MIKTKERNTFKEKKIEGCQQNRHCGSTNSCCAAMVDLFVSTWWECHMSTYDDDTSD